MFHIRIFSSLFPIALSFLCVCESNSNSGAQKQSSQTVSGKSYVDSIQKVSLSKEDTSFSLMNSESIGNIKLDFSGDSIIAILKEPDSKGQIRMWSAIGSYVQQWNFHNLGITLEMASDDSLGLQHVLSISANAPCSLATKQGIKIGSDLASVESAYGAFKNKENSIENSSFVAGSIYGGLVFSIENGKVNKIYIGASAE